MKKVVSKLLVHDDKGKQKAIKAVSTLSELPTNKSIFDGKSEIDQIDKIFRVLGTPDEEIWPGFAKLPGVKKAKFAKQKYECSLRKIFPAISFTEIALSNADFHLLNKLLTYDPAKRITAKDALNHAWFGE